MKDTLENTIKALADRASKATSADEAMKFTQAALNAAHALITWSNIGK
jgi:hypothetical protein